MDTIDKKAYMNTLTERAKNTRITRDYQLIGLEVAELLDDKKHKALYIKLAKEHGISRVLALAKTVAERNDVRNKGAYFMRLIKNV